MEPDISELYAFALLARIDKAVKYIYPPGVHFTIILDGKAYDPFYGYTPEADAAYPDYLAGLVSSAGLSSVISMIDLADMVAARRPEFDALKPKVEARLVHNWRDPSFALREELLHTMRLGSNTYSVNAAAVELAKYSDKYSDNEIVSLVRRMSSAVADRARNSLRVHGLPHRNQRDATHLRAVPDSGTRHRTPKAGSVCTKAHASISSYRSLARGWNFTT